MKPSPEWPIKVELDTLAAKRESPTTGQDMFRPARKYDAESPLLPFFNAHQMMPTVKNTRIAISIIFNCIF